MKINLAKILSWSWGRLSVIFFVGAITSGVQAKTVLWYHFNEQDNGYRPYHVAGSVTRDDVIVNAAEQGSLRGYSGGLNTSAAFTNNQVPTYTNDFPSCGTWYDPVTGARGEDRRCLWMRSQYGDGSGESSIILTDDDAKLHCENITVEFMAKYAASKSLSQQAHMIGMRNASSANVVAWGIIFYTSGKAVLRVQTRNSAGTAQDGDKSFELAESTSSGLLDGNWHHVAFTYDGTTAKLYVDYVLKASKAWSYPIDYNADNAGKLSICGFDKQTYGHWNGFIDEVRISDVALDPSQFLRPGGLVSSALAEKIAAVTDEDTALYLPFDAVEAAVTDPFFGGVGAPFVFNALNMSNAPIVKATFPTSGMLPTTSAATVSNLVHSGIFATDSAANVGCWNFASNTVLYGRSIHMTVNDYSASDRSHSITAGDFTMEFLLNIHNKPSSLRYLAREQAAAGGTAWTLYFSGSGDRLCFSVNNGSAAKSIYSGALVYGEWHHVACVVNRAARTAALYVDGELQGMEEGYDILFPAGDVAACLNICGGGYGSAETDHFHDLSVDELRITRRVLAPQEFLTAGVNGTTALEPTRAWVGFENDLTVEPRPNEIPAGSASASTIYSGVIPGIKIIDGNGAVLRSSNTASMRFSGANEKTMFGRNILLEREMESQTVEFFMKAPKDSAREWAYMLRAYSAPLANCQSSASDSASIMNWTIGYGGATVANPTFRSGEVYVGAVTADFPSSSVTRNFNDIEGEDAKLDDGRWHHVAVTFEPNDTTNTLVTFYKDYKRCGTPKNINGRMKQIVGVSESCLGMGCNFTGWIDEVRISKGVLTVDEMLHAQKPGTVFIFR